MLYYEDKCPLRAWNRETEQMGEVQSINFASGIVECPDVSDTDWDLNDIILLRYVHPDFKDKTDTAICEGDIIELLNENKEKINVVVEYGIARRTVVTYDETGEVEVDIPGFYFKTKDGRKTFPIVNNYAGKHDLQLFEIIGNIHQHPNLFK